MKLSLGLLFLRLGVGLTMMFAHGWPKLAHFSEKSAYFPDPIGLGSTVALVLTVFSEFFCSAFIALGLFTRFAAIPLAITMFVAFAVVHGADPFAKKELALMYFIAYLALSFTGGGGFSLDKVLLKKENQ